MQYQFFKMSFLVPGDLCRDTEVFDHQYWDKRSGRLSVVRQLGAPDDPSILGTSTVPQFSGVITYI